MKGEKLPAEYYQKDDVVALAKSLLGKILCTKFQGVLTSGIITETEAYNGRLDRACHAFGDRRTPRTQTLYLAGGVSYVYLCYGIHHLFNVVTNREGLADAVLIRALMAVDGLETIKERRGQAQKNSPLLTGPGVLTQALGITRGHNGLPLWGAQLWIEDRGIIPQKITSGPRIGVDYAGEDAKLPWRFQTGLHQW